MSFPAIGAAEGGCQPEHKNTLRFTKVGLTRTGVVAGAFLVLEILCRTGIIPRATMIPPTEMVCRVVANPS